MSTEPPQEPRRRPALRSARTGDGARRAALRRGVRARRLRDRVRRRRRRPPPGRGPAARARRPGGARPPRRVRGRRRIVRRRRRVDPARSDGRRGARAAHRPRRPSDPAILQLFLPPNRCRRRAGRRGSAARRPSRSRADGPRDRPLADRPDRSVGARWRRACVPAAPSSRRSSRAPSRPTARRWPTPPSSAASSSPAAGSRPPPVPTSLRRRDRDSRRLRAGRSSTRALSRAPASPTCTPTCAAARDPRPIRAVPPALRDEHAADVAARPAVPGDRPQRRDQHGPRQPLAGPRPRRPTRPASLPPSSSAAGPLVADDGSDSQSLDELLELLVATGWDLGTALLTAMPEALALRRAPHPQVAALRRRTAGFLAPWDGPAAIVFGDGTPGRRDRRPQRAPPDRLRRDARRARGGLLRGRRDPAAARGHGPARPARAGRAVPRRSGSRARPRGRRGEGPPPAPPPDPRCAADRPRRPAQPATTTRRSSLGGPPTGSDLRFLAGLHAENARLDIKTMALEGHEPLWSMGDDTPIPGLGRIDRPVADHLRQSFAQVTNPPIDPERERAVMDLRVELGRRPALLGGPPARLADDPPRAAVPRRPAGAPAGVRRPGPAARRDVAGDRRPGRASPRPSIGSPPRPSPPPAAGPS